MKMKLLAIVVVVVTVMAASVATWAEEQAADKITGDIGWYSNDLYKTAVFSVQGAEAMKNGKVRSPKGFLEQTVHYNDGSTGWQRVDFSEGCVEVDAANHKAWFAGKIVAANETWEDRVGKYWMSAVEDGEIDKYAGAIKSVDFCGEPDPDTGIRYIEANKNDVTWEVIEGNLVVHK